MTALDYLADLAKCLLSPVASDTAGYVGFEDAMTFATNHLAHTRTKTGVVHLIGNGGSASVVAHAQNDLVKACGLRAMVYQDVPLLTAFANDNGYSHGYSDALSIWLDERDVLIAVSSSGASPNILKAATVAKEIGAVVVTCSGFKADNPLRAVGHLNFYVPSSTYGQVELTHAALLHCLTDRLATHA
jgi:D-sedoheptulose 7-phosphate isomerase